MSADDEAIRKEALREVLSYLLLEEWIISPPEMGTNVHRIVKRITGNRDPYKKLKERYDRIASDLYPKLKHIVQNSEDPLLIAAKVAISGNAIDFGPRIEVDIEKEVRNVLERGLAINDIVQLKESASRSKSVLYLADNAGETFFDKILIEEIVK
jgi:uncharacterized protein with ATP-grasp and redox domains